MSSVIHDPTVAWKRIMRDVQALAVWARRKGTAKDCEGLQEAVDALNAIGERFGFEAPQDLRASIAPNPKRPMGDQPIPPYLRGQNAFLRSLARDVNPYNPGTTDWLDWDRGWTYEYNRHNG